MARQQRGGVHQDGNFLFGGKAADVAHDKIAGLEAEAGANRFPRPRPPQPRSVHAVMDHARGEAVARETFGTWLTATT